MDIAFPLQRAFLGLPLEQEAKYAFQWLQEEIREYGEFLAFQNPQSPHLTLYYFGAMMEIEHTAMEKKMQEIAQRTNPFIYRITGADTFQGRGGEDRVLLLSLERSPELAALKKLCPWPNPQPFSPHITLARIRNPNTFRVHRKKIFRKLDTCGFDVPCDRIRFYAEIDGRKQTPLRDFAFAHS